VIDIDRYIKKYRRDRVVAMFLIAIIINSNSYKLSVEDHLYIALLTGYNKMPSKSTISKSWANNWIY